MGVDISCSASGCPPVRIDARGMPGGNISISGKTSSQYLSALLLVAPFAREPITIRIVDDLVSLPYVQMTINLMRKFGVRVENVDNRQFTVQLGQMRGSVEKNGRERQLRRKFGHVASIGGCTIVWD